MIRTGGEQNFQKLVLPKFTCPKATEDASIAAASWILYAVRLIGNIHPRNCVVST